MGHNQKMKKNPNHSIPNLGLLEGYIWIWLIAILLIELYCILSLHCTIGTQQPTKTKVTHTHTHKHTTSFMSESQVGMENLYQTSLPVY